MHDSGMSEMGQARDFLADCVWSDMDEDALEQLTDDQVRAGIDRHYVGGWEAFVTD